ncbi:hypothetical protein BD289DRAFT_121701 [Coniella lustricola]|uniref:Uncharacterized protein n=1 Tax=Coniella lustricola TaxID=2025994 RepID=A0A2T2ZWK8_9PEZI|nr:hypothetical protein BD289DRAFT_121701 [Coniella lustricola]
MITEQGGTQGLQNGVARDKPKFIPCYSSKVAPNVTLLDGALFTNAKNGVICRFSSFLFFCSLLSALFRIRFSDPPHSRSNYIANWRVGKGREEKNRVAQRPPYLFIAQYIPESKQGCALHTYIRGAFPWEGGVRRKSLLTHIFNRLYITTHVRQYEKGDKIQISKSSYLSIKWFSIPGLCCYQDSLDMCPF